MADQLSLQEFAQKIRERRPDLANVPDVTLVAKTLAAAPELKQYVDIGNLPGMNAVAKVMPDDRTAGMVASDQSANVLKGLPQAVTAIPGVAAALVKGLTGNPVETAKNIRDMAASAIQPEVTAVKGAISGRTVPLPIFGGSINFPNYAEGNPADPSWAQAAQGAGAQLAASELPNVLGGAIDAIPNKARAAANFEQIMSQAKDVPINPAAADAIAARYSELKAHGNPSAKVLNDFLKVRSTGEPMTYEVGRDFQTSSGKQSIKQVTKQNAIIQAKVAEFSEAMRTANREAAAKVGMGELFDAAMKEYRQASSIADKAAIIKKWSIPAAALGYAGYRSAAKVYNALNP